jgi:hypothetical protein
MIGNLLLEIFQHTEIFLCTAFISLVYIRLNYENQYIKGEESKTVLNNLLTAGIIVFFVDWCFTTTIS